MTRYDYENCESDGANKMMAEIEASFGNANFAGSKFSSGSKTYVVKEANNYSYKDPVDQSVATKQVNS